MWLGVFVANGTDRGDNQQGYLIYDLADLNNPLVFVDTTGLSLASSVALVRKQYPEIVLPTHRIRVMSAEFTELKKYVDRNSESADEYIQKLAARAGITI
jgi:hypothetical protein